MFEKIQIINNKLRIVTQLLDTIIEIIYKIISFPSIFIPKHHNFRKILVLDNGFVGDSIISLPFLNNLRKHFKRSEIHVLSSKVNVTILKKQKCIDKVITYDTPWVKYDRDKSRNKNQFINYLKIREQIADEKYDIGFDLRGDFRNILLLMYFTGIKRRVGYGITGLGCLLTDQIKWSPYISELSHNLELLKTFKIPIKDKIPKLNTSKVDDLKIKDILKNHKINSKSKIISYAIGAGYKTKLWPTENYSNLSKKLIDDNKNIKIIVTGTKFDKFDIKTNLPKKYQSKIIDLQGKTNLDELISLIKQSDIFISSDSGSSHIASAVKTNSITLFGPTESRRWRPAGNKSKHLIISAKEECSPCGLLHECPKFNNKCMKSITVDNVYNKIVKLL